MALLIGAGVDERHIHADKVSGLKTCLAWLKGDTRMVWKLGRLLPHLLTIITDFRERGIV